MCYTICIKDKGDANSCARYISVKEGQSLLTAAEYSKQQNIAIGCHGGGCGVCRIRILSGVYRKKVMSKTHISPQDLAEGVVLACRVFPESDMEIIAEPIKPRYDPFEHKPTI